METQETNSQLPQTPQWTPCTMAHHFCLTYDLFLLYFPMALVHLPSVDPLELLETQFCRYFN